jgi:Zn-dependent peptidase ImmA (M78 family)
MVPSPCSSAPGPYESSEVVTELPRIGDQRRDLPTSGLSYWNGRLWIIALNRAEPWTRQRFTLFHEYKHIIDHGRADHLYRSQSGYSAEQRAEQAADYFAGCVLMPKRLLKRAWARGVQRPALLADHFNVSTPAVTVRLAQVGLTDNSSQRCAPRRYHRQSTPTTPNPASLRAAS